MRKGKSASKTASATISDREIRQKLSIIQQLGKAAKSYGEIRYVKAKS